MNGRDATVIGGGLAGCEAAWQLAEHGIRVRLVEMKPARMSPAHHSDKFAELVCSNSFRSDRLSNAVGLLKEEMRIMGSLIMKCADSTRVPAGGALAVDRNRFAELVTKSIETDDAQRQATADRRARQRRTSRPGDRDDAAADSATESSNSGRRYPRPRVRARRHRRERKFRPRQ